MKPTKINYVAAFLSSLIALYVFVAAGLNNNLRLVPEIFIIVCLLFVFIYNFSLILNKGL